eukprot:jgi/Chlat1/6923/Chrsp52S06599
MPLIYSCISRGSVVLCEYTAFSGNFSTVALQCLQKLPDQQNGGRFTYTCDRHTFNYLTQGTFTYTAVANEEFGRQIPFAFLERVRDDFLRKHGEAAKTAIAHSLNKDYASKLREHMEFVTEHPEELSKVAKVQKEVDQVKHIMMENIEKVLDRGEKIELLVDKTDALRSQADDFHRTGRQLRRRMWWNNLKLKLMVAGILFVLIFVVFLIACKGFKCL